MWTVQRVQQLVDAPAGLGVAGPLQRRPGVATDERRALAVEAILGQQVTGLHLDELDQLRVVHQIDLVDEDDEIGHADLAGQQDVLPGLRHRAVGRRDQEHRPVHLRRPGDHVLHIIGVAGAVDVGVVPPLGLVLDVAGDDRDGLGGVTDVAALADVLVGLRPGQALARLDRQDGGGQGGLAVVDVADRADVDVNLLHGTVSRSPRSGDRSGIGPLLPIVSDLFTTPSGTRDSGTPAPRVGFEPHVRHLPEMAALPGLRTWAGSFCFQYALDVDRCRARPQHRAESPSGPIDDPCSEWQTPAHAGGFRPPRSRADWQIGISHCETAGRGHCN